MCETKWQQQKFTFDIIGRLQSLINFWTQWKDDITLYVGGFKWSFFCAVNLIKTSYLLTICGWLNKRFFGVISRWLNFLSFTKIMSKITSERWKWKQTDGKDFFLTLEKIMRAFSTHTNAFFVEENWLENAFVRNYFEEPPFLSLAL